MPDREGVVLANVIAFLKSPLGEHIKAVFIDFMSLYQKPRTSEHDVAFAAALGVMADMCTNDISHLAVALQGSKKFGIVGANRAYQDMTICVCNVHRATGVVRAAAGRHP